MKKTLCFKDVSEEYKVMFVCTKDPVTRGLSLQVVLENGEDANFPTFDSYPLYELIERHQICFNLLCDALYAKMVCENIIIPTGDYFSRKGVAYSVCDVNLDVIAPYLYGLELHDDEESEFSFGEELADGMYFDRLLPCTCSKITPGIGYEFRLALPNDVKKLMFVRCPYCGLVSYAWGIEEVIADWNDKIRMGVVRDIQR